MKKFIIIVISMLAFVANIAYAGVCDTVCNGVNSKMYFVTGVSDADSFTWSTTGGITIVSGQGNDTAFFDFTSATLGKDSIKVTPKSACGEGTMGSFVVEVIAGPMAGTLSGTDSVCTGLTTTFSSTSTGGMWSSSNTGVATVDANTGVITGVAAGTATMTYTVSGNGGCSDATATRDVVVTTAPVAGTLSGMDSTCVDSTTTFSSTSTGGTWSSSNTAIVTVDANTGVVTGVGAGTATITYTVAGSGGCSDATATRDVVVGLPPTIAAGTVVNPTTCSGTNGSFQLTGLDSNTFYKVSYGGTATATDVLIPSNASGIITVSNLAAGTYTNISVKTNTSHPCKSNTISSITITGPEPTGTPVINCQ